MIPRKHSLIISLVCFITGGILFLLIGCVSSPPCCQDLRRLQLEEYKIHVIDCKHKALEYCRLLQDAGHEAYIVGGKMDGVEEYHARALYFDGTWRMADPTWKIGSGWPVESYRDWTTLWRFNSDATLKDLIYKTNLRFEAEK